MADDAVVPDVAHLAELDAESNEKYPPAPTATPLLLDAPADMVTAADRYPPHPEQPDLTPAEAGVFRHYR
ncbi:MAG: hypothetical protein QOK39_117 [Acidimicrobiaceae bacterium]|nr:hypothetical protein [Acidimicrobiaceae bacterium]